MAKTKEEVFLNFMHIYKNGEHHQNKFCIIIKFVIVIIEKNYNSSYIEKIAVINIDNLQNNKRKI